MNKYLSDDLHIRAVDPYGNTKYKIILEYLEPYKSLSILNVGCGFGELSILLAKQGHIVTSIDPESEYITHAQQKAQESNIQNCTFIASSLEKYDTSTQYDCVIATDVLEHLTDEQVAIEKLVSLTKPNGLLILIVPAVQWLYGFHDESMGHVRRYSKSELKKSLANKVEIAYMRYFGFTLVPICILYSKILKRAYPVKQVGDTATNPIVAYLLRFLLWLDKLLPMPIGTSLIMIGKRK